MTAKNIYYCHLKLLFETQQIRYNYNYNYMYICTYVAKCLTKFK